MRTFVRYQTRIAERAIQKNRDADLVMVYIEQPDGSGHQFTLTDRRQATDPRNPASIGDNQDQAKIARYDSYLKFAYQQADRAVKRIADAAGPQANVFVVSDHGMAPFHTAVNINNFLSAQGFDPSQVRAVSSGPAVNFYINLQGREPNGTVSRQQYLALQQRLVQALQEVADAAVSQRALAPQIQRIDAAVEAAREAWRAQNDRYQGGLATYLEVLSAEDYLLGNLRTQTDLASRSMTLDVALTKALGGATGSISSAFSPAPWRCRRVCSLTPCVANPGPGVFPPHATMPSARKTAGPDA